jgi:hypothetical protein
MRADSRQGLAGQGTPAITCQVKTRTSFARFRLRVQITVARPFRAARDRGHACRRGIAALRRSLSSLIVLVASLSVRLPFACRSSFSFCRLRVSFCVLRSLLNRTNNDTHQIERQTTSITPNENEEHRRQIERRTTRIMSNDDDLQ